MIMYIVDRLVDKIATSGADKQTTFNKSKLCKIYLLTISKTVVIQY